MNLINKKLSFHLVKIGLTVVGFTIAVLTKFLLTYFESPRWQTSIEEFCFVISSGVFSAMVLVWFIDDINRRLEEKNNEQLEARKIRQFDRILQVYIGRFNISLHCLITPCAERKNKKLEPYPEFSFKDMRDMFLHTGLLGEGADSSIKYFVRTESALREEIEIMVKNIDYTYYPIIQELLLAFVNISLKFNQKETWVNAETVLIKKESDVNDKGHIVSNEMVELMKSGEMDKWYKDQPDTPNNEYRSCFALYTMIHRELVILKEYNKQIKNLNI